LLTSQVKVVNVGLESFAQDLAAADVPVIHVEWSPPAGGDPELADLVSKLGA
jgi:FdrA protein